MAFSRRDFLKGSIMAAGLLSAGEISLNGAFATEKSLFPQHEPLGVGQGIHPGRVVWMHDPKAVNWSGMDFWWKPENFDQGRILEMTRNGIMRLTGEDSLEHGAIQRSPGLEPILFAGSGRD